MTHEANHEERFTKYIRRVFGTTDPDNGFVSQMPKRDPNESVFENIYEISKENGISSNASKKYRVYEPKSSSEYFATMLKHPKLAESESFAYKVAKSGRVGSDFYTNLPMEQDRYRLSFDARRFTPPEGPHNFVIDYSGASYPKEYDSIYKPLSKQLYRPQRNSYHVEDSRHLCSDFVMLSVRKPGAWFDRIDRLLASAKTTDTVY